MSRIVETLVHGEGPAFAPALAALKANGARFVDEAVAANPNGPIRMVTDVARCEISYEVVVGDFEDGRTIWTRMVPFGATDRHCAGGAAFVEAARAQEAVAWAALEILESRR